MKYKLSDYNYRHSKIIISLGELHSNVKDKTTKNIKKRLK